MASEPIEFSDDYEDEAPMARETPAFAMRDEEPEERSRSYAAVWIASILSILWIGLAAAAIYLLLKGAPLTEVALTEWSAISAGLFAPLAAIWLAALVFARVDPGRGRQRLADLEAAEARFDESAMRIETRIANLHAHLDDLTERTAATGSRLSEEGGRFERSTEQTVELARSMSVALAEDRERIDDLISRLSDRVTQTNAALTGMAEQLPAFMGEVERAQSVIAASGAEGEERAQRLAALLSDFNTRSDESARVAMNRAAEADSMLTHIDQTARDIEAQMGARRQELSEAVGQSLHALDEALVQSRESLAQQVANVRNVVAESHGLLEHGAIESSEMLEERLTRLRTDVANIDEGLRRILGRIDKDLTATGTRAGELEGRFEQIGAAGAQVSAELQERLEQVAALAGQAALPLGQLGETVDRTIGGLDRVETLASRIRTDLAGPLADQTTQTTGNFEALSSAVSNVVGDIEVLARAADVLPQTIAEMRGEVAGAVGDVDAARDRLRDTTGLLREQLGEAQALLGEAQGNIDGISSSSANDLIEVLGRVREVARQASGSVRETFEAAVSDALASLEQASAETVERTVSAPVSGEIARLGEIGERSAEAAQASAERLSRSLVAIAETAAALEARIQDANEHIDAVQKADLADQSNLLVEALNSNAIDLTKLMSAEVTEGAWQQYMAGDHSVFTRRAARLIESRDQRQIASLYEGEPEFRESARRYIHDFESMLRRVMRDREGNALSVALLSSDVGRLYVALNGALEKQRQAD